MTVDSSFIHSHQKNWREPKYPSVVNEQTMVHPHNGYYSVMKRMSYQAVKKTWINLECILLSDRIQSERR